MIRLATTADFDELMRVYSAARAYMRENGNPTQWKDGYPQPELVMNDIKAGNMYVLCGDDGAVHACFGMFEGDDPTYAHIEGKWYDNTPYVAVHRVASDGALHGVFKKAFEFVSQKHSHIRIDTHNDNITMQKAVTSRGFKYCGIIYVGDGSPRMAYEWIREK